MRVLVTGGAGFIGTNLIKKLLNDGHDVISVDNYSTGKKENEQAGCDYHDIDLSNDKWWEFSDSVSGYTSTLIKQVDIIFHLAAIARIQPSFEHPSYTFSSNTTATLNVLEWARHHKTPVIYAGSSSSHGDKFSNPYTLSKHQGEQLIELYSKVYDLPTSICRFYNVYGAYQLTEGDYCTLIGIYERLQKEGKTLTVTGDGEQRRDFTHVEDIVDGLVKCGNALYNDVLVGNISGQTFELGRGKNYSVNEIVKAFGETDVEYLAKRPGEMRETLNTDTKARDVLGWKPKGDIIKYIKENYVFCKTN